MSKKISFRWIFLCCWFTYLTAYLCRVNFSSAMQAITVERMLTAEQLGIVGAVFYGVYAVGQLVNGYIGDHVRANRYILLALCGTLACNLGMALATGLGGMLLLWGFNGVFQSMFWSTIIRVLAQHTQAEGRATVSMGISMAMPVAYIASWSLLGHCLDGAAVRWYFQIPAFASAVMIAAWLLLSRKTTFEMPKAQRDKTDVLATVRFIRAEKLHWVIFLCICHGLIKEGVAYWLPLLVTQLKGFDSTSPYLLTSIMPLANVVGIFFSRALLKRGGTDPYKVLVGVFFAIVATAGGLLLHNQGLFMIGMLALISGMCYANNTILMSFIPMQYTERGMVASVIGVFDFASYAGAAISTYVLGKVLASAGFAPLPSIWLSAAALAIVIAFCVIARRKVKGAIAA